MGRPYVMKESGPQSQAATFYTERIRPEDLGTSRIRTFIEPG